jgi:phage-related baseplate assembly protein
MTRYVDIDLSQLPAPDVIQPLDFEAEVAALKQDVLDRIDDATLKADVAAVLKIESEPLVKVIEAFAYATTLVYGRINDAARAELLATTQGNDLDNFAARLDVLRQVVAAADDTTSPPTPAVVEPDADLKERYQLAPEAFSVAGPYGAYHFLARSAHPHVWRTAVYGPESGLVTPGQVLVVVLSRIGDGQPTQGVLDAVTAALGDLEARPLTDQVLVEGSSVTNYAIAYELAIISGSPDPSLIVAAAAQALQTYADGRRRPGAKVTTKALDGAAMSDRVNIDDITRISPPGDVDPGPRGTARCTGITVTYRIVDPDNGNAD